MINATPAIATQVEVPNRELVEAAVRFTQSFQRWLTRRPEGSLSYPGARVLESLHCNGPRRMRDLADELGLSARNVTAVADGLEADELVRRTPHPTDRRATLLELTPTGYTVVEQALSPRLLEISALFDVLSPEQRAILLASLGAVVDEMATRHSHPA